MLNECKSSNGLSTGHLEEAAESYQGEITTTELSRDRERSPGRSGHAASGLGLAEVEPWPEPVEGSALLEELRRVMKRHVVLPPMAAETLALWTLHTYAFELRHVSTYIGIGSPEKRCGKTTLLSVLCELANRPVVASNISPPALFRAIEEGKPTLLIDEADTFLQANDEMRGILNAGYTRKTAYVVRVANQLPNEKPNSPSGKNRAPEVHPPGNGSRLTRFSCWCPKVIAAIGKLPETLMDRCILITMQRKTAQESCERLRTLDGTVLRRKCTRWVKDQAPGIALANPEVPEQLNDRAADIWEPLLALAELAGGEWPKLAREAALRLSISAPDGNIMGSLLVDILAGFVEPQVERIFSREMVAWLNDFTQRPWAEARNGKEIDELWLAQKLRPYGVRPKTIWIGGKAAKGYLKADFAEVWPRYVSRSDFDLLMADRGMAEESSQSEATGSKSEITDKNSTHEDEA